MRKKKRFLAAVLCALMVLAMLPAAAFAAGGTVEIEGMALSAATPYYYNSVGTGSVQSSPTKDNDGTTHYNAYFDSANDTLHLYGLQVASDQSGGIIKVSSLSTLYMELKTDENGDDNDVTCYASDSNAAGINASGVKLVIYGDGKLMVNAESLTSDIGIGISASAIELQYPAELEVKGGERATSVPMTAISTTYAAKGGSDTSVPPTDDYNYSNTATAIAYKFIQFFKHSSPAFPVWVDDTQIDGNYINGKSAFGGTVTYTPVRGATPAKLTLDGVTIDEKITKGMYSAGVYAESYPLRLCLKNSNTIEISALEDVSVTPCGVYSEKALTIEADADASLTANISLSPGSAVDPKPPCAMRADGGITLDSCTVTSPDGGRVSDDTKFISDGAGTGLLGSAVISAAEYGVTLSKTGTHTFDSVTEGYTAAPAALDVTVTNSGNMPTGALDIELSGANAGDFTLSKTSVADITKSGSDSFTVAPNLGLGAGVHTATVTVKKAAANTNAIAEQSFTVQITVNAATTVSSVTVSPATASVEKGATKSFTAAVTGTGNPAQTVTWDVEGETSVLTTINASGVLVVGSDETATTLTVRATSTADTTKSGTATVTTIPKYQITEGQNGKWTKGGTGLRFTADADYGKFTGVSVDNFAIASDKYTVQSGSTIVTLKSAYLETLSVGRHTLRINFTDGYAETSFTIEASDIPTTGDHSQPVLWLSIMLIAGAGLAANFVLRRRRQTH